MNLDEKTAEEVFDVLVKKYPLVFKYNETSSYSFLPVGWYKLLDEACAKIEKILEESYKTYPVDPDGIGAFRVEQIKEKFGSLRFYFSFHTHDNKAFEEVTNIIDRAELDSAEICEVTGNPGEVCVAGNWFKTLSEEVRKRPEYKDYVVFTKDMVR